MRRRVRKSIHGLRDRLGDRLLTVLTALLIVMMFVVAPLQATFGHGYSLFAAGVAALMIAAVLVLSGSFFATLVMIGAFGANLFVVLNRLRGNEGDLDLHVQSGAWLVTSLTLGIVVARAVFAPGQVTYHRIIGAILLYLLIALAFVSLYLMVGLLAPDAFYNLRLDDTTSLASQLIYFSCSTLTTVGYGDIAPVHPLARSLSNLEAMCGQLYPAILIARLVTLHMQERG
jgi:hypothetical protein